MTGQAELFDARELGPRLRRTEGYAATPGSGPPHETCRSCEHYCRVIRGRHVYRKCWLEIDRWRWSETTEIRAGALACRNWQPQGDTMTGGTSLWDVDRELCRLAGEDFADLKTFAPSRDWDGLAGVTYAIANEHDLPAGDLCRAAFSADSPAAGARALLDAIWDQAIGLTEDC